MTDRNDVRVLQHKRISVVRKSGEAAEHIQLRTSRRGPLVRMDHNVPASFPIEELTASLAVRSNHPGARLAVRVVFPNQKDPRTGKTLTALIVGPSYRQTGQWEVLKLPISDKVVSERLIRLRAELKPTVLDLDQLYLDRVVLIAELNPGTTNIVIDELKWSGYANPIGNIQQTSVTESNPLERRVEMRLDRLLIDGSPTVIRFTPLHGEDLERLKSLGMNVLWVEDWKNQREIAAIRELGMWAMATPPRGRLSETGDSDTVSLSLKKFDRSSSGIMGWYLGTRIPHDAREELQTQTRLVRAADRQLRRPIIADIGGLERAYSRMLDGVGISRHPLHTEFQLFDYRRFLTRKKLLLRPGSYVTTWIQTERSTTHGPSVDPAVVDQPARDTDSPEGQDSDIQDRVGGSGDRNLVVVEPEQIRQLAWIALASGCRGIGFWKRTPFHAKLPGARERELMIAIVNQEIELLEPWLATHRVIDYQRISIERRSLELEKATRPLFQQSRAQELRREAKQSRQQLLITNKQPLIDADNHIEIAIVDSANGMLVLPIWYQRDSQFVPGRMAARELTVTIPGVADTATIWEISTTGVRSLRKKPVANGVQIRLENFDQVAALVVSTDPNWGRIIRRKVDQLKAKNAWLWLELAKEKLKRVSRIDQQLQIVGAGDSDGPYLLDQAQRFVDFGQQAYSRAIGESSKQADSRGQSDSSRQVNNGYSANSNEFDSVRSWAQAALRATRLVQRQHWEHAVERQSSALSSPYTACFQTLPDHWQFIEDVGTSNFAVRNLLTSGDFEQTDTGQLVAAGWKHAQSDLDGVQASVSLIPIQGKDSVALRMIALPGTNNEKPPTALDNTPVLVKTPEIPVFKGQLVHISGQVRVPVRPAATLEGVTLHENISGATLRWEATGGWQQFEIVREAKSDTKLQVSLRLHGLGEAQFDNLKVVAYRKK